MIQVLAENTLHKAITYKLANHMYKYQNHVNEYKKHAKVTESPSNSYQQPHRVSIEFVMGIGETHPVGKTQAPESKNE